MERAALLIEASGERLACMLNPENLLLRRRAGIKLRESSGGLVSGSELADDPLLLTGGGTTELTLDLLFDVMLAGSTVASNDVRDLTAPLWILAENPPQGDPNRPLVRFVWGKSWNVPGVIAAVAERLEYFDADGAPRRSWMRMRLLRVIEPPRGVAEEEPGVETHQVIGATPEAEGGSGERLDQLAQRYYGDPRRWRMLARRNRLTNPTHLPPGQLLEIPPLTSLESEL